MNTTPLSRLTTVPNKQRSNAPQAPTPEPQDEVHLSSGISWRPVALLGLTALGAVGGVQAAQAQTQVAPRKDLGQVRGAVFNKGRVDTDGTIRNPLGWPVGKIHADGRVTNPIGWPIGKVDERGKVSPTLGFSVGRVDANGAIRNPLGFQVGRVQGQDDGKIELQEKGGAALLLLMQDND